MSVDISKLIDADLLNEYHTRSLKSTTKSSLEAASMGSTASRQYAVGMDKNGNLSVNVPWTAGNFTLSGERLQFNS